MATTNGSKPLVNGLKAAVPGVGHDVASSQSFVQSFLAAHPDVKFIRYYLSDYSGVLRTRFTTTARALHIASQPNGGLSTASPIISAGTQSGQLLMETLQLGEDVWVPDWNSLRAFGASKGTATVMCSIEEHNREAEGRESMLATCPRTRLANVVAEAKAKHDVDFLVGFEIEFNLLKSSDATEPLHTPDGTWTSNTIRVPEWTSVVEESVSQLEAAGVHVWTFCQEGGHGKYEISLSPLPPLESVDALQFAHETIKTVGKSAGFHVTMHAKPFETGLSAGKHIHMSLSKPELGTPFIAGLLKHFRALCALMQSNVESYQRATQYGNGPITWGWQNKLSCIKRIQDAYFEIRPPDSFGNMYLMLAAILGVGMQGVADKEELVQQSYGVVSVDAAPSEEERKKLGIVHDMPKDFAEALAELKKDELIKRILGEKCFDKYVYNKEKDLEFCKKMTTVERRKTLVEYF